MRLSTLFAAILAFVLAAGLSLVTAGFAVTAIEDGTEIGVRRALDAEGLGWAEVEADGLRVILAGTAPDEAMRFAAIGSAGAVVDAARIVDEMDIVPGADLAPPRFSAEILRNSGGISIIGLIPAGTDRAALIARLGAMAGAGGVTDLLETAAYPAPRGWEDALAFAVAALDRLERSKISVDAGGVAITAIAHSAEAKRALEAELAGAAPPALRLALDIAAPRPVITPFTLRFVIDANGARFDACSAETEASAARILAAARAAGLADAGRCTIGMGEPSPNWAGAAELSIAALGRLGAGSVTFADADITLVAARGTEPALFDRVIGELETALPGVFALRAVLPAPENGADAGPPEFTATLSPEGQVQLRGRLGDETLRDMADSYARARFGSDNVYTAARIVPDLPADWPVRVLAALAALSMLSNGAVTVTPDDLSLRGAATREDTSADIARLLSEKLGEGENYMLDIAFRPPPPAPVETRPAPETCEAEIATVQSFSKIAFEPGSATITEDSRPTMDAIAEILKECGEIGMEIQGHTDSQGREEMNLELSRARARSVLDELRARDVPTGGFVAVGYGETRPIADNHDEAGREQNRRIEFRLIRAGSAGETPSTQESAETGLVPGGGDAAHAEQTGAGAGEEAENEPN